MLKQIIHMLAVILVLPILLLYFILSCLFNSDALFATFSQCFSLLPGKLGSFIRVAFYRFTMTNCHANCMISFASIFSQRNTEIAEGVYIGPQCNIGSCKIERGCLLGSGVHILSGKHQHNFSDLDTPIKEQGGVFEQITIGEDSWLGNGAIVMANIGKQCVIAAGAVVVNDVEDFSIVGGNPAQLIKKRQ